MSVRDFNTASASASAPVRSPKRMPAAKRLTTAMIAGGVVLPMMIMAGCARVSEDHFTVGSTDGHYTSRHPIVIDEKEQTLDIPVSREMVGLTLASQSAVQGVAHRFRRAASGALTIMVPSGSPNQKAARRVADNAADILNNTGVPQNRIRMVGYDASKHGATAPIRISYNAVSAQVTGCGKWPHDLTNNADNRQYHNLGCASQSNLAAMISNPADLVAPRGMSDIDASRRNTVIDDYRAGDTRIENRPEDVFGNGF